jgi:NAD(P)H-flavin reductase
LAETYVLTPRGKDYLEETYNSLMLREVGKKEIAKSTQRRDYWRMVVLDLLDEYPLQTEDDILAQGPEIYMKEAFNWCKNKGYLTS